MLRNVRLSRNAQRRKGGGGIGACTTGLYIYIYIAVRKLYPWITKLSLFRANLEFGLLILSSFTQST